MLLKKLFFSSEKNDKYCKLEQQVKLLEIEIQRLSSLEDKWEKQKEKQQEKQQEENIQPPIIIEQVHIDKILFDKFELNNNLGQLGIKELQGRLNIGATYGSDLFRPEMEKATDRRQEEGRSERKKPKKPMADGPKINIQPKKEI